jgi:uncharacterized protein (DUF58 family)
VDALPYPNGLRLTRGRAFVRNLASGESTRVSAYIEASRRGRYTLPATRADSAFPFNLWRWGRMGKLGEKLIVYPRFTPLSGIDMRAGRRYQPGGIALSSRVGDSMEFHGCREFRDGDDRRRLHWRSWARTSVPVVKEFLEEFFCRTALIVDTTRMRRDLRRLLGLKTPDPCFEAGLSLTAAVADFLAGQDYVVDLFAAGPEVYRFRGGRSLAYLENILDILACLQPHPGEPFSEFSAELIQELAQISSVFFVLLTWNETRRRLFEQIVTAGITVKAVLVTDGRPLPPSLPDSVTLVNAADVREGRCVRL